MPERLSQGLGGRVTPLSKGELVLNSDHVNRPDFPYTESDKKSPVAGEKLA